MIKKLLELDLSKKNLIYIITFGLAVLVGLLLVIKLQSIQKLFPFAFVVLIILLKDKSKSLRITYLDIGFVLLFISEILSAFNSIYFSNSLSSLTRFVVILFLYVLYKIVLKTTQIKLLLPILFFVAANLLLILTTLSFYTFNKGLISRGFVEINNFKNLYYPLAIINNSNINNVWVSALLIFMTFSILFLFKQKKIAGKILVVLSLFLNVFCLIVSFSRGAYLSLFIFILFVNVLLIKYLRIRQLIIYNVIAFVLLSSSAFLFSKPFLTTVAFIKTESQQRSATGRITQWKHSLQLVHQKPILGVGQKNYRLAKERMPVTNEDISFSPRINNTYFQILIERGILGLFLYFVFFLIISLILYKTLKNKAIGKNRKIEILILYSGLLALLVRDLTFSTILDSDFVYFLTFYLVFSFVPYDINIKEIRITKSRKNIFLILGFLLISAIIFLNARRSLMIKYNNKSVQSYFANDIPKSIKFIDKALVFLFDDFYLNKHKTLAFSKNLLNIEIDEKQEHLMVFDKTDDDSLNLALMQFKNLLAKKPSDDELLHNIGWIYFALKKNEQAQYYFEKSLQIKPYKSLYHISLGLLYLYNSNFTESNLSFSKALRCSPDILESRFYQAFKAKYPDAAFQAKQRAIEVLKSQISVENNLIFKARLARLVLNDNPTEAYYYLKEVSTALPNLDRPWIYMAYLNGVTGDTVSTEKYFGNAIFFNKYDFLPKLYLARYYREKGADEKSIELYKMAIKYYKSKRYNYYRFSSGLSKMNFIPTSYFVDDLLFYIKPQINGADVFNFFANYYSTQNNKQLQEYYIKLSEKYKNRLFTGEEELP